MHTADIRLTMILCLLCVKILVIDSFFSTDIQVKITVALPIETSLKLFCIKTVNYVLYLSILKYEPFQSQQYYQSIQDKYGCFFIHIKYFIFR